MTAESDAVLTRLLDRMDTVAEGVTELKIAMEGLAQKVGEALRHTEDHETRIREIEESKSRFATREELADIAVKARKDLDELAAERKSIMTSRLLWAGLLVAAVTPVEAIIAAKFIH